jgi:hypothetical protein
MSRPPAREDAMGRRQKDVMDITLFCGRHRTIATACSCRRKIRQTWDEIRRHPFAGRARRGKSATVKANFLKR